MAIAVRRSGSTIYPPRIDASAGFFGFPIRARPAAINPFSTSAIIAIGSSLRGLSEVSTGRSASRPAISPMIGRLPRSRSPPHPNTQMILPARNATQRRQHRLQRVGLVRVIDQHRDPRFRLDRFESAGGPWASPHPIRHRLRFDTQGRRQSRRAQDIEQIDFADQRRIDFDLSCRAPTASREVRSSPRRISRDARRASDPARNLFSSP